MTKAEPPIYGVTFAYGSNLDPDRIHSLNRCPDASEIGHVRLEGWRLEIFAGAADIEPAPGAYVPAVAWQLTAEDEARLDRREGVLADCPDYVKKPLTARLEDGTSVDGYTYLMTPARRIKKDHTPTPSYRNFLERGYTRHGFDLSTLEAAILRAERR